MADTMTWIDPGGTSHPFDGSTLSISIPRGARAGMFMPPIAYLDQRTPLRPGTTIRYQDIQPRPLVVPVLVNPGVESTLRTTIHSMSQWFNTPAGSPGKWQATGPDGTTRVLTCYYQEGLGAAETDEVRKPGAMYFVLTFLAADPFWHDTSATTITYTNTQMGSSQTINNTSDFLVWPTWTLNGPWNGMTITNTTTGAAIKLTASGGLNIVNGDNVVINTLTGTVILDTTLNRINFLTTDSVLFPLVPGNNVITFTYTGGVNGQTSTQVSYTNSWFSA